MWVRRTATPPPHRFHYHTQSQLDPTRSTPRHFPECPRARGRRRRRARKGPILPPIAPGYGFGTKCPTRSGRRNPGGPAPLRRPPLLTYRLQLVPLRRTPTGASRPSPLPPLNRQRKEKAASMPSWIKLSSRNNGHRPESKAGFTCGQFDGNLERLTPVKRMLPTGFVISIGAVPIIRVWVCAPTRSLSPHRVGQTGPPLTLLRGSGSSAAGPDRRVPSP